MTAAILDAAEQGSSTEHAIGATGVLVCEPGSMVDEARHAVHQPFKAGWDNISYVEEAYSW